MAEKKDDQKQVAVTSSCPPKKLKRKKLIVTENGYTCSACEYETVTFENTVPKVCANCGEAALQLKWRNIIHHEIVIETVKL